MWRRVTITGVCLALISAAFPQRLPAKDGPVGLRPVQVTSSRVADVGANVSRIDTFALRENVALSLADILGFNSSVFVKNYGRATLSTISFRGTSPTHTGVTWNGMAISSPMLGTTDFSMIPSYFVDDVRLVHGASSVADMAGGMGGMVKLATNSHRVSDGFSGQYVQGAGSWRTFDEFLRLGYGKGRWRASMRISFASSANDFPFTNHDKKENVYDENHNIISSYHPRERNRSGEYSDFNGLGSLSYDSPKAGRWSLDTWYLSSNRQLPVLTTDYSNSLDFDNRQREQTIRTVASWQKPSAKHTLQARFGYIHTWTAYDYWRQTGPMAVSVMTRARSRVNSWHTSFVWRFFPSDAWFVSAKAEFNHHQVESYDFASLAATLPGYSKGRAEMSAVAQAKWRPSPRWGIGAVVRQEIYGSNISAPIPALFADGVLWPEIGLAARVSVARNYRYPTLNDLYTVPGGNPDLMPEKGFVYDAGLSSSIKLGNIGKLGVSATGFDSYINDWIMWLPSTKGFYVPRNARKVHSYGVETQASLEAALPRGWMLDGSVNYSYTASINLSDPMNEADKSYGKQLPYIPLHSGSATLRASWRGWTVAYRIQAYSERFTMSSNEYSLSGHLPPYTVSNISLDRRFAIRKLQWQAKLAVNNLFNADYQTVLSHPMPGINFEIFLSLTW